MNYSGITSFREGISKTDNGADDDTTFAFSSSSIPSRVLGIAFGAPK